MASNNDAIPDDTQIRDATLSVLGKRPCLWQVNVTRAVLRGDKDIVSIAGTGVGKTLTFWMPLLFKRHGVQIIVTPLNILGKQNVDVLQKAGLEGIFIGADTATTDNF